ncbi:MAG: thioredoxin domain-containing protein [Gemmatimonadetes bacterium]|nr:thioredoxin domain-containing protein [Gemmatimonadota bacterium]
MIDRIVNVAAVLVVAAAALFFAKAWFASDGVPGVGLVNLGEEEFGLPAEFVRAASTGHRLGPEDAPVVLLLYSDYACGFCREFDRTLRVVRRRYPQHLAVAVKPFVPLEMNESTRLFLGAECAAEQGVFGAFHTAALRLGEGQGRAPLWEDVADSVGGLLSRPAFDHCVTSGEYADRVESAYREGADLGVRMVPTFFVNGRMYMGAMDAVTLDSAVAAALPRAR